MNTRTNQDQENKSQSAANENSHLQGNGTSTFQFVDNRREASQGRVLQEMADNSPQARKAIQLLRNSGMANNNANAVGQGHTTVIQRQTALQAFNLLMRSIGQQIGGSLGKILLGLAKLNQFDKENAEQQILFASAWDGAPKDKLSKGDDRAMQENLIQHNDYGIGDAMKKLRLESDKTQYLKYKMDDDNDKKENIYKAFQNALFFRAERKTSNASTKGYLIYNAAVHGKSGSASVMPGSDAKRVQDRADKYLFVTKQRKEALEYVEMAQGGSREVLNIIASKNEVGFMKFDVDSGGYKTPEDLTGIVTDTMTEEAIKNLNTWLPIDERVVANKQLDGILKYMLS